MQNQQGFLQWMWQNEPWMIPVLIICWIAMISFLCWIRRRFEEAPDYPTPRVMYVIPPIGALIAAIVGAYFTPANGHVIGCMFVAAFAGLILGFVLSYIVHLPKAALRGAGVGLVLTILFVLVDIGMDINVGRNPWLNQAWESRFVIGFLIMLNSTLWACALKTRRLAAEQQPSNPPVGLHPSE